MKCTSFASMLVAAVQLRKCEITSCLDAREIPADPSVVLQIGELRSAEKAGFLDKGMTRGPQGPSMQCILERIGPFVTSQQLVSIPCSSTAWFWL